MSFETQVRDLYQQLLGREPDAEGLLFWSTRAAQLNDTQVARAGILNSPEYKRRNQAVASHRESVFSNVPELATPERIEKLKTGRHSRPLMLVIETINICNNDCIICPYSSQSRKKQTMPLDLFAKILRDYEELGGGALSLTPLVGDVFADKLLMKRIEMIKSCKSVDRLSVTTNGVLARRFDDAELDHLVSSFDRLKISIYGLDAEEYHAMTRKDQYELAMDNIVRLVSRSKGNVVLGLRFLKSRSRDEIDRWVEDLRSRANAAVPVQVKSEAATFANWSFFDTSKPLPFDATWRPVRTNHEQCLIPLVAMQVTAAGDVSFCGCANFDANDRLMLGNVATHSLLELYNTDRCRSLWDWAGRGTPDFCETCSFHVPITDIGQFPTIFSDPVGFIGG